ncbi:MAG TPA: T9SS type A sorting domain-containing protein, partial [Flavipsychrobacter sp.]|nr:T9SS type A sorting domain-containing protein [Flavipsychrobacter sp.]
NGGESSMVVDTTLLFSIRNGVSCGTFVLPDTSFPVSVKENFSSARVFKVFPNPAYDQLTIESSFSDYQLSLINALGQIAYKKGSCSDRTTVDVSGFVPGVYHLKLENGTGEVVNRKIIIQH